MKLIFMGTPEFSVPILDALVTAGHDIVCVYCQPPRPAGRGKKDRPTPVHQRALDLGLPVRHPTTLRTEHEHAAFAGLDADAAIVVAYGLILPQTILDAPKHGCLNIHASLLPRWRGAAPIHRAIMAGDTETGVCIMQMEAGLDTGPVLARAQTPIAATETTQSLHDRLSAQGAALIVDTLTHLPNLTAVPQPQDGITYAHKIDKAEARLDWSQPALQIDRQIRGLSPFPGAWFDHDGHRIKVLASHHVPASGAVGEILSTQDAVIIACGTDAVALTHLQRAGKSAQTAAEFLRGYPLTTGMVVT